MDADAAPDPKNIAASVAVIGGGPAGLMAADVLSAAGLAVTVYERMPAVGRKFLMAGRGGLNLTHREDLRTVPRPLRRGRRLAAAGDRGVPAGGAARLVPRPRPGDLRRLERPRLPESR